MLIQLRLVLLPALLSAFEAYWNFPSATCRTKSPIDFYNYRITTNKNLSFYGENIAIFYEFNFGKYPYYKGYNASFPINGGLPQKCNKSYHLDVARKNITDKTPDYFDGLGIIDFEEWRPLFNQNGYGLKRVFQNESIKQIKEMKMIPSDEKSTREFAAKKFNDSARDFFLETIQLAKKLRPNAKWGFYGFPYCNYDAGKNVSDYECSKRYRDWNDRMMFIYNASSALYPSIYLGFNATSEHRVRYIHAIIKEARRISKKFNPPLPIYAYTKIEYDPLKKLNDFYNDNDLCASITQPANMGVDGIIFWSASANMTQRCKFIQDQMNSKIGDLVKTVIEGHERCRQRLCNNHGKCILSRNTTCVNLSFSPLHGEYMCDCDYGYQGDDCSKPIKMLQSFDTSTVSENSQVFSTEY